MSATIQEIESDALSLPTDQRARLIEKLIASLDDPYVKQEWTPEIEQAWSKEVERRHAEVKAGTVTLLDANQVIAEFRAKLQ